MQFFFLFLLSFCTTQAIHAQIEGSEVIIEHFDYEPQGWVFEDNNNSQAYVKDGVYFIENKVSNQSKGYYNQLEIDSDADYLIEIKLLQKSGKTDAGYGLVWNRSSDQDYLYFKVTQDGMCRIEGKEAGKEIVLSDWKKLKKKDIKRIGQSQILSIVKTAKNTTYFVNDTKMYVGKNIPIKGNQLGILMENQMEVKVDYLRIIRKTPSK